MRVGITYWSVSLPEEEYFGVDRDRRLRNKATKMIHDRSRRLHP
jgi:hypothetical protein